MPASDSGFGVRSGREADASAPGLERPKATHPNPETMPALVHSTMSRVLTGLDRVASRRLLAVIFVAADAVWIVTIVVLQFPAEWETIFLTLVASLTFAMLFVIQHTQSRLQAVTQRKLDAIPKALPAANKAVLSIENANDEELRDVGAARIAIREEAIEDANASSVTSTDGSPVEGTSSSPSRTARCRRGPQLSRGARAGFGEHLSGVWPFPSRLPRPEAEGRWPSFPRG